MFRSLRWRLQAWHALILLLVVAGFGGVLYAEMRRSRFDEIDAELLSAARVLEGVLRALPPAGLDPESDRPPHPRRRLPPRPDGPPGNRPARPEETGPIGFALPPPGGPGFPGGPPPGRMHPPRDPGPPGQHLMPTHATRIVPRPFSLPNSLMERYSEWGEAPYFVVRGADGAVLRADPSNIAREVPPDPAVGRWYESHSRNRGRLREVTLLGPGRSTILVGRSIHHELDGLRRMAWRLGLTGLGVFAAGLVGGWWLSSRAVRPIVAMSETVSGISANSLSRRLDLDGVDSELGGLGALINTMLGRLEDAFARQVRFTADASHELRTPLAVILSQVELALSRPREGPAYRESLEACGRAARRMTSLVEDLLTLARADSGKLELRVEPIDFSRIAESSVALLEPLAGKRRIRIRLQTSPAPMKGDPERLGQVITNLLSNAIQYNREGGEIVVSVRHDEDSAIVVVEDSGVGIPESELPLIFDRFHRIDTARSRQSGGSGLGLAICRSIVEAHGGTIRVESVIGRGSLFTVAIPRGSILV
ncbi:MAG: sensor histidine kinase [Isosphaeraceae bacterium]